MEKLEILPTLTAIFRDLFEDSSMVLSGAMNASDVPGWTSLMHINLILEVEEVFGIRIGSNEIEKLVDVGSLLSLIERKAT